MEGWVALADALLIWKYQRQILRISKMRTAIQRNALHFVTDYFLTPQFAFVFVGCSFAATQERRVQGVWSPDNFGNESFSKDRRSNRFYHSQINSQLHETNREFTHIFYACVDTLAPVLQYLTEQRVHLCFNESNFLEVRAFESKPRTSEKRN